MNDHAPRLLDALDAFEDGIYIVSEDFTVEYMNRFMKDLFGDGVGQKCHKVLLNYETPCEWCNYREIFEKNETRHSEIHLESVKKSLPCLKFR